MPVTIKTVLELPDLGLLLRAGAAGADREVRWVHASETTDPTRWLKGGELLLTTGLQLAEEDFAQYARRLDDSGAAGIGFGVGLRWAQVPAPLLRTADELGLPVLEVPIEAPWVAISENVSRIKTEERNQATTRVLDAQRALTAAAIAGGGDEVVRECARRIGGWAAVADADAAIVRASSNDCADRVRVLRPDLHRARERGASSATALATADESVTLLPLTSDGTVRGLLVVGVPCRPSWEHHMIASAAAALLTLEVERTRAMSERLYRLRSDTLGQLIRGTLAPEQARRTVARWRLDVREVRVCVLRTAAVRVSQIYASVIKHLTARQLGGAACVRRAPRTERMSDVAVLLDGAEERIDDLVALTATTAHVTVGIGEIVDLADLPASYDSAARAADVGLAGRRRVTRFDQLGALHLFLHGQPPQALETFVRSVLGPLDAAEPTARAASLRDTLREFLARNGQWSDTAHALGIHRHTLRARIERIEEITGRSLGSAYDRMEFWLALLVDPSR